MGASSSWREDMTYEFTNDEDGPQGGGKAVIVLTPFDPTGPNWRGPDGNKHWHGFAAHGIWLLNEPVEGDLAAILVWTTDSTALGRLRDNLWYDAVEIRLVSGG